MTALDHDSFMPAPGRTPAHDIDKRESAVSRALEPHGLTLVIFPAPGGGRSYGIARAGDPDAVIALFDDLGQAGRFTAELPGPPPPPPTPEQEWAENCPRCRYPFTATTEADLLRRLLDHITYEHLIPARRDACLRDADGDEHAAPGYHGMIRIEWPPPNPVSPYTALPARLTAITDAITGDPISTVSSIIVHADATGQVTAELTMLADQDGQPLTGSIATGGGYREGTFTYVVHEMSVRETPAP